MGDIKFISYDGDYPNLCRGTLTLEIDGEVVKFGGKDNYPSFWESSGGVSFSDDYVEAYVSSGEWVLSDYDMPDKFKPIKHELIKVMNDYVEHGCCGGCI